MTTIGFDQIGFLGGLVNPTSLTFGADQRLYVTQQNGEVIALEVTIQNGAFVEVAGSQREVLSLSNGLGVVRGIINHDDDGSIFDGETTNAGGGNAFTDRQVTGIVASEDANGNPVFYVSSSDTRISVPGSGNNTGVDDNGRQDTNLDTNSGIITKVIGTPDGSGGFNWDAIDIVRGLPRSEENHSVNGMVIDAATNTLYVQVGGNTNNGAPGAFFSFQSEYALSGTILAIDLEAIDALPVLTDSDAGKPLTGIPGSGSINNLVSGSNPATERKYVFDFPTLDDPNIENVTDGVGEDANGLDEDGPFGGNDGFNQAILPQGAPVRIFADGIRNGYDLVLTRDGNIYTVDNGSNANLGAEPVIVNGEGTNIVPELENPPFFGSGDPEPLFLITEGGYFGHGVPVRGNPDGSFEILDDNGVPFAEGAAVFDIENGLYIQSTVSDISSLVPESLIGTGDGQIEAGFLIDPQQFAALDGLTGTDFTDRLAESSITVERAIGGTDNPLSPSLVTLGSSTNGIVEYTGGAFGGAIDGALIVTQFNDNLTLIKLNEDGTALAPLVNPGDDGILGTADDQVQSSSGLLSFGATGNNPLDLIVGNSALTYSPPEFDGIILSALIGADNLVAFAPSDGSLLDDVDFDNDNILDINDPFTRDSTNGASVVLLPNSTLVYDFDDNSDNNQPGPDGLLTGLTGVATNGSVDFEGTLSDPSLFQFSGQPRPNQNVPLDNVKENTAAGGGANVIELVSNGTASGTSNTGEFLFQTGVTIPSSVTGFNVTWAIFNPNNIFDPNNTAGDNGSNATEGSFTPNGNQEIGGFIGVGDQSNFLKVVLTNGTAATGPDGPGFLIELEENDVAVASVFIQAADVFDALSGVNQETSTFTLSLDIDTETPGSETAVLTINYPTVSGTATVSNNSTPISLANSTVLDAILGNYTVPDEDGVPQSSQLAVGLFSTNGGDPAGDGIVSEADAFTAQYDGLTITATNANVAGPTVEIINPFAADDAGLFVATDDNITIVVELTDATGIDFSSIQASDLIVTVNGISVPAADMEFLNLFDDPLFNNEPDDGQLAPIVVGDKTSIVFIAKAPAGGWDIGGAAVGQPTSIDVTATLAQGSILNVAQAGSDAATETFTTGFIDPGTEVARAINSGGGSNGVSPGTSFVVNGVTYEDDSLTVEDQNSSTAAPAVGTAPQGISIVTTDVGGNGGIDGDVRGGGAQADDITGARSQEEAALHATDRQSGGNNDTLTYTISTDASGVALKSGTNYAIELSFAETFFDSSGSNAGIQSAGQRVFDVLVNGNVVITDLDLFARAPGTHVIIERTVLAQTDASGNLVIAIAGQGQGQPKISGFKITEIIGDNPTFTSDIQLVLPIDATDDVVATLTFNQVITQIDAAALSLTVPNLEGGTVDLTNAVVNLAGNGLSATATFASPTQGFANGDYSVTVAVGALTNESGETSPTAAFSGFETLALGLDPNERYDENVDGDLADDPAAPTVIPSIQNGSNLLTLFAADADGDDNLPFGSDRDYFTIVVPDGSQLTALILTNYDADSFTASPNDAFLGLAVEGETVSAGTSGTEEDPGTTNLIGGVIFGEIEEGQDILPILAASAAGSNGAFSGFTVPLDAGTYNFWLNQNGAVSSATFDFQITAVGDNAPVFDPATPSTFDAPENDTGVIFDFDATDPDGEQVTYSISASQEADNIDAAAFSIDSNTGELSFDLEQNFEIPIDNDESGDYQVVVEATANGLTTSQAIVVNLTDENDLPVITGSFPPSVNVTSGSTLDISALAFVQGVAASDEDFADVAEFSVRALGGGALPAGLTFANQTLTVGAGVVAGNIALEVFATDGSSASAISIPLTITVGSNVTLSVVATDVVENGDIDETTVSFTVQASDSALDATVSLTYSLTDPVNGTVQTTADVVFVAGLATIFASLPTDDLANGSELVSLSLISSTSSGFVIAGAPDDTASASVTEDDFSPVAVNDTTDTVVDTPVTFNPAQNDTDGDTPSSALTVTAISNVSAAANEATVDLANGQVTVTPLNGFTGSVTFDYTVEDPAGNSDIGTASVSIGGTPVTIEAEDFQSLGGSLGAFFVENQNAASGGQVIRLAREGSGTATLDLTPALGVSFGTNNLSVSIFDESDGVSQVIVSINRAAGGSDTIGTISFDQDGGGNAAQVQNLRTVVFENIVLNAGDTLVFEADANAGEFVRIDSIGLFPVNNNGGGDNQAPFVVSPVDPQSVLQDDAIFLPLRGGQGGTPVFVDPDEQPLILTLDPGAPEFLSIDANGNLVGTPDAEDAVAFAGGVDVGITATDPGGLSVQTIVNITVDNVNDAPVVETEPSDLTISTGTPIVPIDVSAFFSDADIPLGDVLGFTVDGLPAGLSFDGIQISGSPVAAGVNTVTVTATDSFGEEVSTTFEVTTQGNATPVRIQAESFNIQSGWFVENQVAADDNQVIRLANNGSGTATVALTGVNFIPAGNAVLKIGVFDENDGNSELDVYVDDVFITTVVLDLNAGTNIANAPSFREIIIPNITLGQNSVLRFDGRADNITGPEPLRFDYIEVVPSATTGNLPPFAIPSFDTDIQVGEGSFTLQTAPAFGDPEEDPLTFALAPVDGSTPVPSFLSIDPVTGVISGTQEVSADTLVSFNVTATDAISGQTAVQTIALTIVDTSAPTVNAAFSAPLQEGVVNAVAVTLTGISQSFNNDVTVRLVLVSGVTEGATPGDDIVFLENGLATIDVVIAAGTTSLDVPLSIIDDGPVELAETIRVEIAAANVGMVIDGVAEQLSIGNTPGDTEIADGDFAPIAVDDTPTVQSGGIVTFDPAGNDIDADLDGGQLVVTAIDTTATLGAESVVLNADGTVTVTADGNSATGDIAFSYTVSDQFGNVDTGTATVSVVDGFVASVSPTSAPVAEGDDAIFTVSLSDLAIADTTVTFTVTPGSAAASDLGTTTGSVVIASGQSTANITVSTINDLELEGLEDFTLAIDEASYTDPNSNLLVTVPVAPTAASATGSLLAEQVLTSDDATDETLVVASSLIEVVDFVAGDPGTTGGGADIVTGSLADLSDTVLLDLGEEDAISISDQNVALLDLQNVGGPTDGIRLLLDTDDDLVADATLTLNGSDFGNITDLSLANFDVTNGTGATIKYVAEPFPLADGRAVITANNGGTNVLNNSTFGSNNVKIFNTSSNNVAIQQVIIDLEDTLIPDIAFDTRSQANGGPIGDIISKGFDQGSQTVGFGGSGTAGPFDFSITVEGEALDTQTGQRGDYRLILDFPTGAFAVGDVLSFGIDIDPFTATNAVIAGAVSGQELTGAKVTVTFEDGTSATSNFVPDANNTTGGTAIVQPGLDTTQVSLALGDGTTAARLVNQEDLPIAISAGSANAGDTVRIFVLDTAFVSDQSSVDIDPPGGPGTIQGNNIQGFSRSFDVQLDANGDFNGTVPLTRLTTQATNANGNIGFNYISAGLVQQLNDSSGVVTTLSTPLVVEFDPSANVDPIIPGIPFASISAPADTQESGDTGSFTQLQFDVTFSSTPSDTVTVEYALTIGNGPTQNLTAEVLPTNGQITVDVPNDDVDNGDDDVTIVLTGISANSAATASIGVDNTARASVIEDDVVIPQSAIEILGLADGNFDGIVQGQVVDSVNTGGPNGAVVVTITDGDGITQSNFANGSFTITNTGNKEISAVFVDIRGAVFGDQVFDIDGTAGDTSASIFEIDSDGGTGAFFVGSTPATNAANLFFPGDDPLPDTSGLGSASSGGYRGLLIRFTDFDGGETVTFSGDGDPNSIAGFSFGEISGNNGATFPAGFDTGAQAGSELIGSSFTTLFADGSLTTGYIGSDTTGGGGTGEAVQGRTPKVASLSVDTGVSTVSSGQSGTYGGDIPVITVFGDEGDVIRVTLHKGFNPVVNPLGGPDSIADVVQNRLDVSNPDFPVNAAFDLQTIDVVIPVGETSLTLPVNVFDYVNTTRGISFAGDDVQPLAITAVVIGEVTNANAISGENARDKVAVGPVSDPVYLINTTETPVDQTIPVNGPTGFFEGVGSGASFRYKIQIEDLGGVGVAAVRDGTNQAFVFVETGAPNDNNTGAQGDGYFVHTGDDTGAVRDIIENGFTRNTDIQNNPFARDGDNQLIYRIEVPEEQVGEQFSWRFRVTRDPENFSGNNPLPNDQQNDIRFNVISVSDPSITLEDLRPNGAGDEGDFLNGFARVFGGPTTGVFNNSASSIVEGEGNNAIIFPEAGLYDFVIAGRSIGYHLDYFDIFRSGSNPSGLASNSPFVGNTIPFVVSGIADREVAQGSSFDVSSNFDDRDGDTLTLSSSVLPAGVSFNNGVFTIGADASAISNAVITVTATDDDNNSVSDAFLLSVGDNQSGNQAPVAQNDNANVQLNNSVTINVLINDSDPDNDLLDVVSATNPQNGSVVVNANNTITYTPNSSFVGTDFFSYTITDGEDTDTANVVVNVNSNGENPTTRRIEAEDFTRVSSNLNVVNVGFASGGQWLQSQNASLQTAIYTFDLASGIYDITGGYFDEADGISTINLLLNDVLLDSFVFDQDPAGSNAGPAEFVTSVIPNVSISLGDILTLQLLRDGGEPARIDYLDFTPQEGGIGNSAPNAVADTAVVNAGQSVIINVLDNDSDPDATDTISLVTAGTAANGTVAANADNTVTYTPNTGFTGTDIFTYTITDGDLTDTATVTVNVDAVGVEITGVFSSNGVLLDSDLSDGSNVIALLDIFSDFTIQAELLGGETAGSFLLEVLDDSGSVLASQTDNDSEFELTASASVIPEGSYSTRLTAYADDDLQGGILATDEFQFTVQGSTPPPPPPAPFRVEAETLTLVTSDLNIVTNGISSGGAWLQSQSEDLQIAEFAFAEVSGIYDLTFGIFDESDGQSSLDVLVDGSLVGTVNFDVDPAGANASPAAFRTVLVEDVEISNGDVISFNFFRDAGEPARFDYVDFEFDMII